MSADELLSNPLVDALRRRVDELTAELAETRLAVHARDDFLAMAGHELRTPLNAFGLQIAALERLARRGGDVRLAAEITRARRTVHRYAKRAALLLDVTRLNAGRLELQVVPVRLAEIVADVVDSFSDEAAFCDATLRVDAQRSLVGEWDAQSIEAIVSNLVSNALKYGGGGEVRVAAQPDDPGWARLSVTDNGPGIDDAQRHRIFDKFERVVDGNSERGFGLGLWIVGRLIEAHGGTIDIDTTPGSGSTFAVRLPLHPVPVRNLTTGAFMRREEAGRPAALERFPTGVSGLDEVLGGGLLKAGAYVLQGTPGSGKTILANQICYGYTARGGRVVYLTMLAESHSRMLQHLQSFSFYDEAAIPESIYYVSAFEALRSGGLDAVVTLLRGEMLSHRSGLLVLDGLVMAARAAGSDEMLKLFISEIQAHSVLTGCTTLILTSIETDRPVTPEQTMVDGILLLRECAYGPRRERNLEVTKFRGSATLRGSHAFRIGPDGIIVFPRLESAHRRSPQDAIGTRGLSTGIAGLDQMIDAGGFPKGSVTAVAGYAGSGKTTLALHFLAQSSHEEPGLFFGFYESPEFLVHIGRTVGIDMDRLRDSGALQLVWQPYGENILDELAYRLLDAARSRGARRIVIDGIGGFLAAPAQSERGASFFASLSNELRRLGATTVITAEAGDLLAHQLPVPTAGLSALADNMVRLRIVEHGDQIRRLLSIGKMRSRGYDLRVREIRLTPHGLRVDPRGPEIEPGNG